MALQTDDTIAALSSAPGSAARGILRLSGPDCKTILEKCFQASDPEFWKSVAFASRHAGRFHLSDPPAPLPVAIYLWPTSRSYTGLLMAEIHTTGSPPLLESALTDLYAAGARPARPGEFTLRAFLAGKIDLVQAEAVLGVIDAHDFRELDTALKQLAGGLSGRLAAVRGDLLNLLADLEAGLDFVEEDIEFVDSVELTERIERALQTLNELIEQSTRRMLSTARLRVVLAGLPNAGKSTLFNALAGREAALVSEIKGTTRDYLSAELNWNGTAVELIDTAGWESVSGENQTLEYQADRFRNEQIQRADLVLWCTAADFSESERAIENQLLAGFKVNVSSLLLVLTKCDLEVAGNRAAEIKLSAHAKAGLSELTEKGAAMLSEPHRAGRQFVGMTAARCRECLQSSIDALREALLAASTNSGDELVSLEIRSALDFLGTILGTVYTDDILDRIFSRFCIGK